MTDTLRVTVRVTPRGGRDQVEEVLRTFAGDFFLRVRVKAPPEDGKANAAVQELLAAFFSVPRAQISLLQGAKTRLKVWGIQGDLSVLRGRLESALGADEKRDLE